MKILFYDIETAPAVVYTWSLREQTISIDQVIKPTSLLCFAAKWAGEKEVMYYASENYEPKFKAMIRAAHKLLSEADAVCYFNGDRFDRPRLNQEFLKLGLPPPPPIPSIDLKKVVFSRFDFTSSKLAFLGPELKIGEKVKNSGWDLWRGCLNGDKECWKEMERYNRQDVLLLEKLYYKLLPWIENHPNANLYEAVDKPLCPNCGSARLQRRGHRRAVTCVYARFQCVDCHAWSRARTRDKTEPVATIR